MADNKIDIKKTFENIINKANSSIGISINIKGFNKKVKEEGESFIKEAAKFVNVPVKYKKI